MELGKHVAAHHVLAECAEDRITKEVLKSRVYYCYTTQVANRLPAAMQVQPHVVVTSGAQLPERSPPKRRWLEYSERLGYCLRLLSTVKMN